MSTLIWLLWHPIYGAIIGGAAGLVLGLLLAPLIVRRW